MTRYRIQAALTLACTLVICCHPEALRAAEPRTTAPGTTCRPLRDLYSARAIARIKRNLQLQLFETRIARLERARLAIEHLISVSQLLDPDVAVPPTIEGQKASRLKQTPAKATTHVGATQCL